MGAINVFTLAWMIKITVIQLLYGLTCCFGCKGCCSLFSNFSLMIIPFVSILKKFIMSLLGLSKTLSSFSRFAQPIIRRKTLWLWAKWSEELQFYPFCSVPAKVIWGALIRSTKITKWSQCMGTRPDLNPPRHEQNHSSVSAIYYECPKVLII